MSENTKIEWTDHSFNPWEGCQRVGPGCDHCYAETRNARYAGGTAINWGPGAPRRRTSPANWKKPIAWNKAHAEFFTQHGRRQRVFCASLADVFDNAVDPAWRRDLFVLIEATPNLDWLLLTKRIGNVRDMVPVPWVSKPFQHGPDPKNIYPAGWPKHVRLGITVVNQPEADRDIEELLDLRCPNFLSMEPLLGAVDLSQAHAKLARKPWVIHEHLQRTGRLPTVDWVIVGGESGPGARAMHPDWARSLRDQCEAAGVPFLFKQWGEWRPMLVEECRSGPAHLVSVDSRKPIGSDCFQMQHQLVAMLTEPRFMWQCPVVKVGKKAAGRELDGQTWNQTPIDQRIAG